MRCCSMPAAENLFAAFRGTSNAFAASRFLPTAGCWRRAEKTTLSASGRSPTASSPVRFRRQSIPSKRRAAPWRRIARCVPFRIWEKELQPESARLSTRLLSSRSAEDFLRCTASFSRLDGRYLLSGQYDRLGLSLGDQQRQAATAVLRTDRQIHEHDVSWRSIRRPFLPMADRSWRLMSEVTSAFGIRKQAANGSASGRRAADALTA